MRWLRNAIHDNRRLMLLTFELFWILVFLLDRIGNAGGSGIPQFVYVNF